MSKGRGRGYRGVEVTGEADYSMTWDGALEDVF